MITSTTPKGEERAARERLKALARTRAAKAKATARRRADIIRDELSRPRAKDCRRPITQQSTLGQLRALGAGCTAGQWVCDPRRDPPEAWNMSITATPPRTPPSDTARDDDHSSQSDEYQVLWAMSRSERIAAMWRSQLTMRQLSQWSSRAPHEVPLLGGEFAWIVMRTPEWAEASTEPGSGAVAADHQEVVA